MKLKKLLYEVKMNVNVIIRNGDITVIDGTVIDVLTSDKFEELKNREISSINVINNSLMVMLVPLTIVI